MPIIILLLFALIGLTIGPLVTIWALNLLFSLSIPYTFATWFATLWLGMVVGNGSIRIKQ